MIQNAKDSARGLRAYHACASLHAAKATVSSTASSAERAPGDIDFTTVGGLCVEAAKAYASRHAFGTRNGDKFDWTTYKELGVLVQKFRNVLTHHNVGRGDKVSIISNNRLEWAVAMYAVTGVGAQLVPMYEAQLEKDWQFIIKDSDSKMVLCATEKVYDKVKHYVGAVGVVQSVLCFDSSDEYLHSYKRWMELVKDEKPVPVCDVDPNELCTIIYTSGTTGTPKGVELSHNNIVSNLRGLKDLWRDGLDNHVSLAFLPWAHVFGQTAELHSLMATGSAMAIVSNREQILESLAIVRPTLICSVPVLFNKVYDGVQKKIKEGSAVSRFVFSSALSVARKRNSLLEHGQPVGALLDLQFKLADKIVFSKIRERLGGRLRCMASGGAATALPVVQFFEDIGIPIAEGYGLTETSPVITAGSVSSKGRWATRRLGCAGVPLQGCTVKILDPETKEEMPSDTDGEICCAGPNVMVGYRNNKKANDEVFFFKDGKKFFRTGDLGRLVEGKFLKITGRIKEQFKLENGKYVVPAPLEDAICRSQFVAQALLYGDNRIHTVVLVVPELLELRAWAVKNGITGEVDTLQQLLQHQPIQALLTSEIAAASATLKAYERPLRWAPLFEPFSQDNQMLTPKLSLRRNNILKVHQPLVEALYTHKEGFSTLTAAAEKVVTERVSKA
jgi:long-chain acyl-CoA synthetase